MGSGPADLTQHRCQACFRRTSDTSELSSGCIQEILSGIVRPCTKTKNAFQVLPVTTWCEQKAALVAFGSFCERAFCGFHYLWKSVSAGVLEFIPPHILRAHCTSLCFKYTCSTALHYCVLTSYFLKLLLFKENSIDVIHIPKIPSKQQLLCETYVSLSPITFCHPFKCRMSPVFLPNTNPNHSSLEETERKKPHIIFLLEDSKVF